MWLNLLGADGWASPWGKAYVRDISDKGLVKHELKHLEQYKRYGKLKFTALYLIYWIRYGYEKNPFEVEAREAERSR